MYRAKFLIYSVNSRSLFVSVTLHAVLAFDLSCLPLRNQFSLILFFFGWSGDDIVGLYCLIVIIFLFYFVLMLMLNLLDNEGYWFVYTEMMIDL